MENGSIIIIDGLGDNLSVCSCSSGGEVTAAQTIAATLAAVVEVALRTREFF